MNEILLTSMNGRKMFMVRSAKPLDQYLQSLSQRADLGQGLVDINGLGLNSKFFLHGFLTNFVKAFH